LCPFSTLKMEVTSSQKQWTAQHFTEGHNLNDDSFKIHTDEAWFRCVTQSTTGSELRIVYIHVFQRAISHTNSFLPLQTKLFPLHHQINCCQMTYLVSINPGGLCIMIFLAPLPSLVLAFTFFLHCCNPLHL